MYSKYVAQLSKGGILAKTYTYIEELCDSNQKLLNINEKLRLENAELRNLLKQNGISARYVFSITGQRFWRIIMIRKT